MSPKSHKLQVLAILSKNLTNPHPQLVPSASIAQQMDLSLPQLQKVLKSMEGGGEIETDMDLQYSLITQKGLKILNKH